MCGLNFKPKPKFLLLLLIIFILSFLYIHTLSPTHHTTPHHTHNRIVDKEIRRTHEIDEATFQCGYDFILFIPIFISYNLLKDYQGD